MSFLVSGTQPTRSKPQNMNITNNNNTEEEQEYPENLSAVRITSHVRLKPAHSTEILDKKEVLLRIRQRKRANKFRATLHGILGFLFSSKTDEVSVRWVDDNFAAP